MSVETSASSEPPSRESPHAGALESSSSALGLGDRLRLRRRELGWTLAQAAARAGLAPSYLSMIERGRVTNPPSSRVLAGLAGALSIEREALEHAAEWARAGDSVRSEAGRLREQADRGRELAAWLLGAASRASGGGGSALDRLYQSGQLRSRIDSVLGRREPGEPVASSEAPSALAGPASPAGPAGDPPADPEAGVVAGSQAAAGDVAWLGPAGSAPLINKVAAGHPADFTDLGYPARAADAAAPVPPSMDDPDAFAARVTGDSMEPAYREGDLVIFSPAADVIDGCDCFARLEPDHETTFKRVRLDDERGLIRLEPLNPQYPVRELPRERVAGLFRAVWKLSRL
ncbi:MAG: S24 family peptidase [Planctomycetota bacterium]